MAAVVASSLSGTPLNARSTARRRGSGNSIDHLRPHCGGWTVDTILHPRKGLVEFTCRWTAWKTCMKNSSDRILTTHTGSLPRPADLVSILNDKELGAGYDRSAYQNRIQRAVSEIVCKQADLGLDIIDDG